MSFREYAKENFGALVGTLLGVTAGLGTIAISGLSEMAPYFWEVLTLAYILGPALWIGCYWLWKKERGGLE